MDVRRRSLPPLGGGRPHAGSTRRQRVVATAIRTWAATLERCLVSIVVAATTVLIIMLAVAALLFFTD
jgi:hypothetical protein